jgi:hypothetical protein
MRLNTQKDDLGHVLYHLSIFLAFLLPLNIGKTHIAIYLGHVFNHPMSETFLPTEIASETREAILRTLLYFEFFAHPLSAKEVWLYLDRKESELAVAENLKDLVRDQQIFQFGPYFQTLNDARWVPQRMDNQKRAEKYFPIARRMAHLIGAFPFIRAVFVSGSLSKSIVKPDGDIDFFLITTPGRLWLARTLLVLFKKIFLFNSHKYFCVNYFIDTEHLEIEEQNLFTATETVTLLPLYGAHWYQAFCRENKWAWSQFPNVVQRQVDQIRNNHPVFLKTLLERMFSGKFGTWLDRTFMKLTLRYWDRKFKPKDATIFEVALKSRRYVSKHHPLNFQKRVLEQFEKRCREVIVQK